MITTVHMSVSRLSVPELVRFNRSSYSAQEEVTEEAHIGPEIVHIYQVHRFHIEPEIVHNAHLSGTQGSHRT